MAVPKRKFFAKGFLVKFLAPGMKKFPEMISHPYRQIVEGKTLVLFVGKGDLEIEEFKTSAPGRTETVISHGPIGLRLKKMLWRVPSPSKT